MSALRGSEGTVVYTNFQAQVIIPGPFTSTTRLRFFFVPVDAGRVFWDDMIVEAGTLDLCSDGIQNGDEEGIDCGGSQCDDCPETFVRGDKRYELTNHLGNVMAVISDRRFSLTGDEEDPRYRAYTINASEYYPFGLEMEGRKFNFGDYRFGFNGKEADTDGEWGGEYGDSEFRQTHYDYGFRIYNPSIGKFLSVDPLAPDYPWYTPYQFAGNKPIWAIDLDGLEEAPSTSWRVAGGNMEYNQDGDYYRFQRAEGDILKTWITNPDNSGWIFMGGKRNPATYDPGGLSLNDYVKSNYTSGIVDVAFYGIGGVLFSPALGATSFNVPTYFAKGASINLGAQLTIHSAITAYKGEFSFSNVTKRVDIADVVFGGLTGGISTQVVLPSVFDFTLEGGVQVTGLNKSSGATLIDGVSNSLFFGLGELGSIFPVKTRGEAIDELWRVLKARSTGTESLANRVFGELKLSSVIPSGAYSVHSLTKMLEPLRNISFSLGQYLDVGEQATSNTAKEILSDENN